MRTIHKKISHKILRWTTALVLIGSCLRLPLFSATEVESSRLSISISAGVFYPLQESFRRLYGSSQWPVSFQLDFRLSEGFFVFTGFRYLFSRGETAIVGEEYMPEHYPINLAVSTVKLGLFYTFLPRRVFLFFGGGVNYNFYKERWEETPISFEGKRFGFLAQGGARYSLSQKFSLVARIEYSSVPTKASSKLASEINLGGLEFSLGFSFKF